MVQSYFKQKTSIVIVTFLSDDIIDRCIQNLGNKYKIYVIENSDRHDFKKKIESHYNNVSCHLMGYDAGFPKAANYGIDVADTDFVFLINPDTFPDNNCILKLEDFSNHSESHAIVFPITLMENDKVSFDFGFFNGKKIKNIDKKIIRIDYSNGNAIFVNKRFFGVNKVFDEQIFLQFDDTELCWRLKKMNKDIFMVTDAKVKHLQGKSHKKQFDFELKKEVWWHNGWSHIYLGKKYYSKTKFLKLVLHKVFKSLFMSIACLFFIRIKSSQLYYLNFKGTLYSLMNKKSSYRSKINF